MRTYLCRRYRIWMASRQNDVACGWPYSPLPSCHSVCTVLLASHSYRGNEFACESCKIMRINCARKLGKAVRIELTSNYPWMRISVHIRHTWIFSHWLSFPQLPARLRHLRWVYWGHAFVCDVPGFGVLLMSSHKCHNRTADELPQCGAPSYRNYRNRIRTVCNWNVAALIPADVHDYP